MKQKDVPWRRPQLTVTQIVAYYKYVSIIARLYHLTGQNNKPHSFASDVQGFSKFNDLQQKHLLKTSY